MTRLRKPSPAMIAMLENVATGLPTIAGLRGRSEHGAATQTEASLRNRGLLDQMSGKPRRLGRGRIARMPQASLEMTFRCATLGT